MAGGVDGVVEVLVVGGGGGGGENDNTPGGGGGGGGGVRFTTSYTVTAGQSVNVTIGNGGASNTAGQSSTFGTLTAAGGGYGANYARKIGGNGGAGGGGTWTGAGGSGNVPSTSPIQGFNGGTGHVEGQAAGGGGGAGGTGGNASNNGNGGGGGNGIQSSITGQPTYYGGGGGGGSGYSLGVGGSGGQGGGGAGGTTPGNSGQGQQGHDGSPGTGGGGGGAGGWSSGLAGGAGGSGIVIVRYASSSETTTYQATVIAQNFQIIELLSSTNAITRDAFVVELPDSGTQVRFTWDISFGQLLMSSFLIILFFYNVGMDIIKYSSGGWLGF